MQEKKTTGILRVFILLTFAHLGGRKDLTSFWGQYNLNKLIEWEKKHLHADVTLIKSYFLKDDSILALNQEFLLHRCIQAIIGIDT